MEIFSACLRPYKAGAILVLDYYDSCYISITQSKSRTSILKETAEPNGKDVLIVKIPSGGTKRATTSVLILLPTRKSSVVADLRLMPR